MQEFKNWKPPILPKEIEQADVPGSKVVITEDHIDRANRIFPDLLEEIEKLKKEKNKFSELKKNINKFIKFLEELEKIYGYNYEYIELNILKGLCITRNKYK